MKKTQHYQLNKPEVTDPLRVADFNDNANKIDTALANLNTALGSKAEQSAVAAVETALGSKANTSDLSALSQTVSALSQTVSALSTTVSGKGNCKIATGSYVGTGTYGASNPTTLTFPFVPTWVMIAECGDGTATEPVRMNTSFLVNPMRGAASTYDKALRVTWSGNSVSWYCDDGVINAHLAQNNRNGCTYYWVALCMG